MSKKYGGFPEISRKLLLANHEYMYGNYREAKDIVSGILNQELKIASGYDSLTEKEYGHIKLECYSIKAACNIMQKEYSSFSENFSHIQSIREYCDIKVYLDYIDSLYRIVEKKNRIKGENIKNSSNEFLHSINIIRDELNKANNALHNDPSALMGFAYASYCYDENEAACQAAIKAISKASSLLKNIPDSNFYQKIILPNLGKCLEIYKQDLCKMI